LEAETKLMRNFFWGHAVLELLEVVQEVRRKVISVFLGQLRLVLRTVDLEVQQLRSRHELHSFRTWPDDRNALCNVLNQTLLPLLVFLFLFFLWVRPIQTNKLIKVDMRCTLSVRSMSDRFLFEVWGRRCQYILNLCLLLLDRHCFAYWLDVHLFLEVSPHVLRNVNYRIEWSHSFMWKSIGKHALEQFLQPGQTPCLNVR